MRRKAPQTANFALFLFGYDVVFTAKSLNSRTYEIEGLCEASGMLLPEAHYHHILDILYENVFICREIEERLGFYGAVAEMKGKDSASIQKLVSLVL